MSFTVPPAIAAAAIAANRRRRIPASLSLSQWALESGHGRHEPPGSNNPFGIKAKPHAPGVLVSTREEDSAGHSYFIRTCFAQFPSEEAAFDAHAQLLAEAPCYARMRAYLPGDVRAACRALTGVYATAHNYGDVLWSVIVSGNLLRFDAR